MTRNEYLKKQNRFSILFDKWFCENPIITAEEKKEMDRLRDDLAQYERYHAFLSAVRSGEISPCS